MYSENYKILIKEFKAGTNKWKDIPCSWVGRLNIVKIQTSQSIYRFNMMHIKIPMICFSEMERTISKFTWDSKIPRIAKAILRKKQAGSIILDFRLYYKSSVIKTLLLA